MESDELRLEMDRLDSALEALRSAHQMLGDGWPTMPQWRIATRYKGATGGRNLPSGPRGLASAEDVAAERFDSYQVPRADFTQESRTMGRIIVGAYHAPAAEQLVLLHQFDVRGACSQ